MSNENIDYKTYCEAVQASYSRPSVPVEETAIGKEVKAYMDERDKEQGYEQR